MISAPTTLTPEPFIDCPPQVVIVSPERTQVISIRFPIHFDVRKTHPGEGGRVQSTVSGIPNAREYNFTASTLADFRGSSLTPSRAKIR